MLFRSKGVYIAVGKDIDYLAPSADGVEKLSQAHKLAENLIKMDMQFMNEEKPAKIGTSAFLAFCSAADGKEESVVISANNKNIIISALSAQGIFPQSTSDGQIEVALNTKTMNLLSELVLDNSGIGSGITYIDNVRRMMPVTQ